MRLATPTFEKRMHPANDRLEGFAAGDPDSDVAAHLNACEICRANLQELQIQLATFRSEAVREAPRFVSAVKATAVAHEAAARETASKLIWVRILGAIAVAAVALFGVVRMWPSPEMKVAINDVKEHGPNGEIASPDRFKGGTGLTVIRERNGIQERLTSEVIVRPGDRIRAEIVSEGGKALTSGLLAKDRTYIPMLPAEELAQGTHYSREAVKFDNEPFDGWLIVGSPDEVEKAQQTGQISGLRVIAIHLLR